MWNGKFVKITNLWYHPHAAEFSKMPTACPKTSPQCPVLKKNPIQTYRQGTNPRFKKAGYRHVGMSMSLPCHTGPKDAGEERLSTYVACISCFTPGHHWAIHFWISPGWFLPAPWKNRPVKAFHGEGTMKWCQKRELAHF